MEILPCKLGCPLLPYLETVGSSVCSPLLPNIRKWAAQCSAEWAAHGNFAMQIRLPTTTSIYRNSGQLSGQPTTSKYEKSGQLSGQWSGLPMGILPCKSGCPLLPYIETVGSSVGSQLLPNMKKVSSSVGSGVGCPLAAHGNFSMQIRLPTTFIYGYSG